MRYIILFLVAISAIAQVDPDLAAPEQLSASDADYYNKTMIRWHALRGAHSYRIYRHSTADSANATLLGSTAAPMFLDSTATPGVTYQYWVAGESNTGIGALAGPEAGSRGVGSQNGPVGPLEPPQDPTANPTTAAKVALGKALFWDEQLSSTRTVSCASCHQPASGGIDPRSIIGDPNATNPGPDGVFGTADDITASPGVPGSLASGLYDWKAHFGITTQVTGRTSRPSFDAAYSDELFWDGRANGLEDQAAGPPVGDSEMAHTGRIWDDVVNRVIASHPLALASDIPAALASWIGDDNYPTLFGEAFGNNTVTADRVTQAIAAYERTLFSDRAPIDKARANLAPLNEAEVRGLDVFVAADCFRCHADATGSDDRYHNIGLRPTSDDPGRFGVTGNENDRGRFRTSHLRNASLRSVYFHNGAADSLAQVIDFYNRGGDFDAPNVNNNIRPLNLSTQEKTDLEAFLETFTDPRVAAASDHFDHPTLYLGSDRQPEPFGSAITGSSTPQIIAIEPPLAGNPNFTVGVYDGPANASATFIVDITEPGGHIPAAPFHRQDISLDTHGAGSASLAIPENPAAQLYARWYVGDSATQPVRFTIFGDSTPALLPTADAGGPYAGLAGDPITLDASASSAPSNNIVSYDWDLDGDGSYDANGVTVSHSFSDDTDITLRVTTADSASDSATGTVDINHRPTADHGSYQGYSEGDIVPLDASASSDPDGSIVLYEWNFANDSDYDATGVTHNRLFPNSGKQELRLRVTDNEGATAIDNSAFSIANVAPIADAGGPRSALIATSIDFDASASSDPGNDIVSYEWDWDGDGSYDSSGISASQSFFTDTTVTLRVTDADSASHSATVAVTIFTPISNPSPPLGSYSIDETESLAMSVDGFVNRWYVDDVHVATGDSYNFNAQIVHPARSAEFAIRCNDVSWTVRVDDVDQLPDPPAIILPTAPSTLDDLTVGIEQQNADPDGDAISYDITWQHLDMREAFTGATLASENTRAADLWQVTIYASTQPYGVEFANSASSATAEVFILNSAPTAFDQDLLTLPGDDLPISLQVTDPDDQDQTFVPLTAPRLGTLRDLDSQAGTLIYRAEIDASGSDSFTFRTTDSTGTDSNNAEVRIQVGGWLLPIAVTGAQVDSIGIGQHPLASDSFDSGLDSLAPPALGGEGYVSLGRDIRPEGNATWNLDLTATNTDLILEWDTQRVLEHSYILGDSVLADMQSLNRLEIPAGTTASFTIHHGSVPFDLTLASGWNLISTPIQPEDPAMFGDNLFTWANGQIIPSTTFEPRRGYYYHNPGPPQTIRITGTPVADSATPLSAGWNFCAATGAPPYASRPYADVLRTPHRLPIWGYDGAYRASQDFEAGKAYFVWSEAVH